MLRACAFWLARIVDFRVVCLVLCGYFFDPKEPWISESSVFMLRTRYFWLAVVAGFFVGVFLIYFLCYAIIF